MLSQRERTSTKRTHVDDDDFERPSKRQIIVIDDGAIETTPSTNPKSPPIVSLPSYATLTSSSPIHALSIIDLFQTVHDSNHGFETRSEGVGPSLNKKNPTFNIPRESHFTPENCVLLPSSFPTCHCTSLSSSPRPFSSSSSASSSSTTTPNRLEFPQCAQLQPQPTPVPDYMERQSDLNEQMRAILFDWLVEVAEEYKLKSSTLFLTVSIIDRFLSEYEKLNRDQLQLVGVSSMLIAAKIEEINPPTVHDLVFISDNAYTKTEISNMERKITSVLRFKVITPTVYTYLCDLQKVARLDEEVCQLSNYLAELSLLEYTFIRFEPLKIAASVIALALHSAECTPWSTILERCSGYDLDQLRDCMTEVLDVFADAPLSQLQAVREKYSAPNPFLCVASMAPPDTIPVL